jgi:sugar diacid utilization regulator
MTSDREQSDALACGCVDTRVDPLHVAVALRSAALDAMPVLWDTVAVEFADESCALRYLSGRVVALVPVRWGGAAFSSRFEVWHNDVSERLGVVSAGRSATHGGHVGVPRALQEATRALTLGERLRGPGHLTAYGDVFAIDYARGLVEDGVLTGIYEQVLCRLGAFDQAEGAELVPTLDQYLACGGSTQRAASAMGIHRNTVLYRLKRMEELVHVDLADGDVRFFIQLALRAHRQLTSGRQASAHVAGARAPQLQ